MTSEHEILPSSAPNEAAALRERLSTRGWEFDFFQAVWLLERLENGKAVVGDRGPVVDEPIRLRPNLSLGFPPTDVRRIRTIRDEDQNLIYHLIDVSFMGLYGVDSPLPLHYAMRVIRSVQGAGPEPGDKASTASAAENADPFAATSPMRDFLDIIHHRILSLFYRSWTKYRYDRAFGAPCRDSITDYLRLLIGMLRAEDGKLTGLDPVRLIRYAGLLTQHPRSSLSLEGLLEDYWDDVPVKVLQYTGRWVALPPGSNNAIGRNCSTLGVDLTVGEEVYDVCGAFDIAMGPVDWNTFLTFLPTGPRFRQTAALTRLFGQDRLGFTQEIRIRERQIPELKLSSDGSASQLGFTSWARTGEMGETSVRFLAEI